MNSAYSSAVTIIILVCISLIFSLICAQNGLQSDGLPVLFICVGIAIVTQWIIFVPSYLLQTEKYYDLTGSITTLLIMGSASYLKTKLAPNGLDSRSFILAFLVSVWTIRLGVFLYMRIRKAGEDKRFREWKKSWHIFLRTWTIQGVWVFFTCLAALTAITGSNDKPVDISLYIGLIIWLIGFSIEFVADLQKSRFRDEPNNKNKFINSGLWSLSRHPNYLGEIILWFGISIIALPVLKGWQYFSLISPIFVYVLLTKVSGIPILEKEAEKKWGAKKSFQSYKKQTPLLFPKLK
tara:strand:- start:812 stop:1693 length:882 start_codon:yes stop_codon:yes gene_type:complete